MIRCEINPRTGRYGTACLICELPAVPPAGSTFYPSRDIAGMEVVRTEFVADDPTVVVVVEASGWSDDELLVAGFGVPDA